VGGRWWLSDSWGVGVTFVTTYGIERFGRTQRSGDRTWIGRGELHYVRYQACRRHRLSPGWNLEYGFGLTEHASFNILGDLDTPSGVRRIKSPTWFSAFAGEVSIRRALGQHFGVRAGVMLDGNIETTIVHPVVSAVVAF